MDRIPALCPEVVRHPQATADGARIPRALLTARGFLGSNRIFGRPRRFRAGESSARCSRHPSDTARTRVRRHGGLTCRSARAAGGCRTPVDRHESASGSRWAGDPLDDSARGVRVAPDAVVRRWLRARRGHAIRPPDYRAAVLPLFTAVSILGTVVGQLVVLGLLESRVLRTASRVLGLVLLLVLMALSYAAMAPVMGVSEPLAPLAIVALPAIQYLAFVFVGTPFGPALDAGAFLVGGASSRVSQFYSQWRFGWPPPLVRRRDPGRPDAARHGVRHRDDAGRRGRDRPIRTGVPAAARAAAAGGRARPVDPLAQNPRSLLCTFPARYRPRRRTLHGRRRSSSLPLVVGGVLIFAGVYVSGAVFGLNPLGEAADMRIVEFLRRRRRARSSSDTCWPACSSGRPSAWQAPRYLPPLWTSRHQRRSPSGS